MIMQNILYCVDSKNSFFDFLYEDTNIKIYFNFSFLESRDHVYIRYIKLKNKNIKTFIFPDIIRYKSCKGVVSEFSVKYYYHSITLYYDFNNSFNKIIIKNKKLVKIKNKWKIKNERTYIRM